MSDTHRFSRARSQAEAADIEDLIDDLREFLDDQQDAEYFTDSPAPTPNQAVRLLLRLNKLFPEEGR